MISINRELITEKIEKFNPLTEDYKNYWKSVKRKCIEGYWIGNTYIPGTIYFYRNIWNIKLNKDNSKSKTIGNPHVRDIEWLRAYLYMEARGFSGFELDTEYHCNHYILQQQLLKNTNDTRKFMTPENYLNRVFDKPLGKALYLNPSKNILDLECFHHKTKVLKYDGSIVEIGSLQEGDLLMGPDSKPRKVLNKAIGVDNFYKIKSSRFKEQLVTKNHLIAVEVLTSKNGSYVNGKRGKKLYSRVKTNISVKEALEKQKQVSFRNKYYLYQSPEITFNNSSTLKIDPYYLGLWLSDGRSNCTSIKLTDFELWDYLKEFALSNNIKYSEKIIKAESTDRIRKEAREYYYYCPKFRQKFKDYKLIFNKHIPSDYLISSKENRLQLLAGLLDGDGWWDTHMKSFGFISIDYNLTKNFEYLCRSLGFNTSTKIIKYRKGATKIQYSTLVNGDFLETIPTKIKRKQVVNSTITRINKNRSSFVVEKTDIVDKFVSIEVNDDNLFLLDDFTVVHNCRDSGKSYWVAALAGMNFLFDGALDYDEYLSAITNKKPMSSETMIGAIDAFYSNQTCNKLLLGLDNLEGSQDFQDVFYPSPLAKFYDGSLVPSKFIIAKRKVKVKENWVVKGSKSMVHHRTFFGNELAGNSIRPSLAILDEVGFMDNLTHALGHLKDSTSSGGIKTGTIYMIGTGGDSKGKGTEEITKVFNNPEEFDCVSREDLYENKGRRCFFIPKILAYDSTFRDDNGFTILEKAQAKWDKDYEEAKKSSNIETLNSFYQNSPLTPSHALLSLDGNRYPSAQIHEQLCYLEALPKGEYNKLAMKGYLDCDEYGTVTFRPDLNNELRDCSYPIRPTNKKGCVTIYKLPQDTTWLNYIGGLDPIGTEGKKEDIQSDSVASLVIMSRGIYGDEIVAEYTGREDEMNDTNEIMRRLIVFYNAFTLYENNYNNFKIYMQGKNQLHFLAKTPNILKAGVGRADSYGLHATSDGNKEMVKLTSDWLKQKSYTGEINIKNVNSIGLLKELLAASDDVNTDRESALKLCIVLKLQLSLNKKKEVVNDNYFSFFNKRYDKQGNLIKR